MKKLLMLLLIVGLISCDSSNVKDVTEKEEIPVWITKTLGDTTLKFDAVLLETEGSIFIIKEINSKKEIVKEVTKNNSDGAIFIFGIFIGFLIIGFLAAIFD